MTSATQQPSVPRRRHRPPPRRPPSPGNGTRPAGATHQVQRSGGTRRPNAGKSAKPVQLEDDDVTELEAMLAMIEVSAAALPAMVPKAADPAAADGGEDSESPVDDDDEDDVGGPSLDHIKSVHVRGGGSVPAVIGATGGAKQVARPVVDGDDDEMLVSDSDDEASQCALPAVPQPTPTKHTRSSKPASSTPPRPALRSGPRPRPRHAAPEPNPLTHRNHPTTTHDPAVQHTAFLGNICPHTSNAEIVAFVHSLTSATPAINPRPARPRKSPPAETSPTAASHVRGAYVTFASNKDAIAFVEHVNALNAHQRVQIAAEGERGRVWVSYVDPDTGRQVGWRARVVGAGAGTGGVQGKSGDGQWQGGSRPSKQSKADGEWHAKMSWRSSTPASPTRQPRTAAHDSKPTPPPLAPPAPGCAHPASLPPRRVPWRPPGGPLEMVSTGVAVPDSPPKRKLAEAYLKPKPAANGYVSVLPDVFEREQEEQEEIDEDRMTASEDEDEDEARQVGALVGLGRIGW